MNRRFCLKDVLTRFDENKMTYEILPLGEHASTVVTQYGGRVIGPFFEDGAALCWLNEAFSDAGDFRKFVDNKMWNIGGDRVWTAPEHPFFVKQRDHFFDTFCVSKAMDPGRYTIEKRDEEIQVAQDVITDVFQGSFSIKEFSVSRRIYPVQNPLFKMAQTTGLSVQYCGYEQEITLEDLSPDRVMPLESWELLSINPGGRVLIPYYGTFDFVDYYEPTDAAHMTVHEGFAEVTVDGCKRYKTAFYALNTMGRSVYVNKNENGYYLIYKQYYNDPSNPYCCDPYNQPGKSACSLYIYNDAAQDNGFGGFENSGLTIGKGTHRTKATTNMTHMFFTGARDDLEKIITVLLGIRYRITF